MCFFLVSQKKKKLRRFLRSRNLFKLLHFNTKHVPVGLKFVTVYLERGASSSVFSQVRKRKKKKRKSDVGCQNFDGGEDDDDDDEEEEK